MVARNGVKCPAFADDLKLYLPVQPRSDKVILQKEVDDVYYWPLNWSLPLSEEKTRVLHNGQTRTNFQVKH